MNHKHTMHKLEELKRDKLETVKTIHKEISKIDASIQHHRRLYLANNKYSDECRLVLGGYSRENVKEVLAFLIDSMSTHDEVYIRIYKGVNVNSLIEDENFFDFLIVQIGRATIVELKKRFEKVAVIDGDERVLATTAFRGKASHSFNHRLFKKLSKRVVVQEAKRVTLEAKNEKPV